MFGSITVLEEGLLLERRQEPLAGSSPANAMPAVPAVALVCTAQRLVGRLAAISRRAISGLSFERGRNITVAELAALDGTRRARQALLAGKRLQLVVMGAAKGSLREGDILVAFDGLWRPGLFVRRRGRLRYRQGACAWPGRG